MLSIIIYYIGGTSYTVPAGRSYIASTILHRSNWWRPRMRDDQSYIGQLYRISAKLTLYIWRMYIVYYVYTRPVLNSIPSVYIFTTSSTLRLLIVLIIPAYGIWCIIPCTRLVKNSIICILLFNKYGMAWYCDYSYFVRICLVRY